jgi:radical SAM superfamily enzyme YgiQ (UPF0313 family)
MFNKILFTQFGIPDLDTLEYKSNIPLAAGYLSAYAKKKFSDKEFIITPRVYTDVLNDNSFLKYAEDIKPDLFLFSLYVWNIERTLRLCSVLIKKFPDAKFLFGGPEVNPDNRFLLNDPAFTAGIVGEGELPLMDYLKGLPLKNISGILTKDFFNPAGRIKTGFAPDDNPYITGLIEHRPDTSMYFETVRGCPFKCGFCYYNKVYDKPVPLNRDHLEIFLNYARKNGLKEVFLLDPSFNAQSRFDDLLDRLTALNTGGFFEFNTELRADLLTDDQIRKLQKLNLCEAEIGLQTTNPRALEIMNRTGSVDKTIANSKKMFSLGMKPKIDLIAGLPGDTLESFKRSVDRVFEEGLYESIQVFRLSILSGTDFSINREKYGIEADDMPPYHIRSVPGFTEAEMLEAIDYARDKFDTELFYIPSFLLSCDFRYLRKDRFVQFDSDIKPVHKIIFSDHADDSYKSIKNLCESLVLHFKIEDPEKEYAGVCRILDYFSKEQPDSVYQIILEFTHDYSKKHFDIISKHISYKYSYNDRDASAYFGDCTVSTRVAVVLDIKYIGKKVYKELCSDTDVFIAVSDLNGNNAVKIADAHKIYVKGPEQEKIFRLLKKDDLLSEFVIFDSFRYEYKKFDITGSGRLYFPHSVEI